MNKHIAKALADGNRVARKLRCGGFDHGMRDSVSSWQMGISEAAFELMSRSITTPDKHSRTNDKRLADNMHIIRATHMLIVTRIGKGEA